MKDKVRSPLPIILCFAIFIGAGLLLHLLLPDREYSENENRYLASAPEFTAKALFSGSFTADFEDYVTDQFPFRDSWLDLKSRSERAAGKTENNGVFFCKDDTLISRFSAPEDEIVTSGIRAVNALKEHTDVPVTFALIPSSAAVWTERLPKNADTADQEALIRRYYKGIGGNTVNVLDTLREHAEEPVFYRTDHHWTTLGAYYGYAATAAALGLTPAPRDAFSPETVSSSFYGTVYSSSGVRWVKPDRMELWVPEDGVSLVRYDTPEGIEAPVYDRSKLQTKDQYGMFLGGNTSRLVIETGSEGGKLLVIRDSFADCELPFFFRHYAEIHVLDLRYYRRSVSEYIEENGFDAVLVSYSLADFTTDTSVSLLAS